MFLMFLCNEVWFWLETSWLKAETDLCLVELMYWWDFDVAAPLHKHYCADSGKWRQQSVEYLEYLVPELQAVVPKFGPNQSFD